MDPDYESDLKSIECSGPHAIDDSHRVLNRAVRSEIFDLFPIHDIHKVSDADLIFRFLIAHRWHPQKAADAIREYVDFRARMRLNTVLWEEFPSAVAAIAPRFHGTDKFGFPVFYDRPNPTVVGQLLVAVPRETLLRAHLAMMERGRRYSKALGVDRVTAVIDLALLNSSIVTNPSAMGLLKEFSTLDQKYYPENMRTMVLQNTGWAFSALYSVIRPLLDERVQKKIQNVGSGAKMLQKMESWLDLDTVLTEFGGRAVETVEHPSLDVRHLPPATPYSAAVTSYLQHGASQDHEAESNVTDGAVSRSPAEVTVQMPTTPPPLDLTPVVPIAPKRIDEFFVHRSVDSSGIAASTAFTLGYPVVQRCENVIVNAAHSYVATIIPGSARFAIVDEKGRVRYVVRRAFAQAVRTSKLNVFRPRDPESNWSTIEAGPASAVYLSMTVELSNEFDARDWRCVSHTRKADPLVVRTANHVSWRKEMLAVPVPVIFALATAICHLWPYPTAL